MGITEILISSITAFISSSGYLGITFLMILESMVVPVPSEAVLPFAGFLLSEGRFTFLGTVLAATIGSIIGSFLSYYMGQYGGNAFVKKFGKYVFLNEHHLLQTEQFFARRGNFTVFIARFIPVVRHLISIPAGMAKMNKLKFFFYTVLGAGMWNAILIWTGIILKQNWIVLRKYTEIFDILIVGAIVGLCIWFFLKKRKEKR